MPNKSFADFLSELPVAIPVLPLHPLDAALRLAIPEDSIVAECGVHTGNSLRKIAGAHPAHRCFGFDSFEGLPEKWNRPDMTFDKGAFAVSALPSVPSNTQLVKGWFDETLPRFVEQSQGGSVLGFLHVDCDLYSSARTVLTSFRPLFGPRTIVVFDELLNYPGFEQHEIKALYEFMRDNPDFDLEWLGKYGPVILRPERDNGYVDQPVACTFRRLA